MKLLLFSYVLCVCVCVCVCVSCVYKKIDPRLTVNKNIVVIINKNIHIS